MAVQSAFRFWASGAAEDERLPDGIVLLHNLRYREGASPHWTLDLAMPRDAGPSPRAAIVVIHGGGWIEGDKSSFSVVKNRPPGNIIDFAQLGFVAVTINYRLSTEAPFPAALDDCKTAVRWLRAHAGEYRVNPDLIGAWGNSAGGHLALLLGMTNERDGLEGDGPHREFPSRVQAVVSDSGPIDLLHQHQHQQIPTVIERLLNGPPEAARILEYERSSPKHYVKSEFPPLMLIYGEADTQVGIETSDAFVAALQQAGHRDVSYLRLGNVDHCPHSLIRVSWLAPAVNEFFLRTLRTKN